MRLLNTRSFEFQEFFDADVPRYAILSHRWTKEEVSHHDFVQRKNLHYGGYAKIKAFCEEASTRDLEWGWVDTCCIDKSSSAELTEAINSMFRWYEDATVCLVYLSDVRLVRGQSEGFERSLVNSQWFTRGWTLQELIAPHHVWFYDSVWHYIGDKTSLAAVLSQRTGIEKGYLSKELSLNAACIAERMSWAARRETSRYEDMAYCLLGLFDIQMPLLYGEGKKAFARLQDEIIRKSDDESIFAYSTMSPQIEMYAGPQPNGKLGAWEPYGNWQDWMAAPLPTGSDMYSPNSVRKSNRLAPFQFRSKIPDVHRNAYSVTHKGIYMDVEYYELKDHTWLVPLLCIVKATGQPYYMLLRQSPYNTSSMFKVRIQVPQSWIHQQLIEMGFMEKSQSTRQRAIIYLN